jgi:hypothetical protein
MARKYQLAYENYLFPVRSVRINKNVSNLVEEAVTKSGG